VAIVHLRQRVDQDEVVPRSIFSLDSSREMVSTATYLHLTFRAPRV
jgi:hypothetical protein